MPVDTRRKFCSQFFGASTRYPRAGEPIGADAKVQLIRDPTVFKRSMPLQPLATFGADFEVVIA